MRNPAVRIAAFGCGAAALALVTACSQQMGSPVSPSIAGGSLASVRPSGPGPRLATADVEHFEICKNYASGTGPAVTMNVVIDIGDDGSTDQTFSTTLAAGQCEDVWVHGGPAYDRVTVTEVVPAGYSASSTVSTVVGRDGTPTTTAPAPGPTATGVVRGDTGGLIVFTNTLLPPPPPPPGGGEGCTPGYWKARQHFDSWTAPYTPDTLFSAVFENAFPGKTLDEVLGQGGGGLQALGRHTVAALLNAASSGVSFELSTTQVIALFNGVYPGGDYETLKNRLAQLNEAGCPLN